MPERFAPTTLFDLTGRAHADLFAGLDNAWEALAKIGTYVVARGGSKIEGEVSPGAYLVGDGIHIGVGSVVEPGAYIQGPCIIGRDTEVRHGAYIRGKVIVGDRCVVGHATEIKGSIMLDGAKAGHFAYVGDSILGVDVNLGAGTKLANLRLDERTIRVRGPRIDIDTGLRKLGAILGDGVTTGCNSVTNPGVVLGPKAILFPCAAASGYHPGGSVVRRR